MRVLIVKTSSLGDLVHTLPAVTDAARGVPGLRLDWLCERAFAEIPHWHPAVQRVITCDLRRWRKSWLRSFGGGDWSRFVDELRREPYDLILDAQGLVKSAWLASRADGPRAGPGWASAREPLASLSYDYRLRLPAGVHAIDRLRALFAQALGYAVPADAPDYGIDRARLRDARRSGPYVVLLHATTWPSKTWPEASWRALGAWLRERGVQVLLPWGSEAEHQCAQRIAQGCDGVVLPRLSLTVLAGVLAQARAVVGVDTGLAHVAAAVGTPTVTLYGPTLPGLTGTVGTSQVHLRSTQDSRVDRARPNTVELARVTAALEDWLPAR